MFEDLSHDRGEQEKREKTNKPPSFPLRFGTNPNMMAAWRKIQEERKRKKEDKG